jgi:hypothetical protein
VVEVLAAFGVLLLPWMAQVRRIPDVSDEMYFSRLAPERLAVGLSRMGEIVGALGQHLLDLRHWHVLFVAAAAAAVLLGRRGRLEPAPRLITVFTVLYLAAITLVYVLSPWRRISEHIDVSADRVLLPLLPALVLLLTYGMRAIASPRP